MAQFSKSDLLQLVRRIPLGRVASPEILGAELGVPAPLVQTMLAQLSEDERELVPWYRVVAKGGAIGRGLHRDQQFARLVREGVMISPAGIVQDLSRQMIVGFDDGSLPKSGATVPGEPVKPGSRSRGVKERP